MYDAKITSAEPTLLVILLDQSSSMDVTLIGAEDGERFSIARMAKYVVDEFLTRRLTNVLGKTILNHT